MAPTDGIDASPVPVMFQMGTETMTLSTTYTTLPFTRAADGQLRPGVRRHLATREAALAAAEHLAPFYAGVVVLKQQADAGNGDILEPIVIGAVGDVPQELLSRSAA